MMQGVDVKETSLSNVVELIGKLLEKVYCKCLSKKIFMKYLLLFFSVS